ncbi:MAG: helix-turn-helix transcriptional regulator [Bacteroides sp.]|nr:helix-turn-helix transcriptional regulator [Bacteroides sp.]
MSEDNIAIRLKLLISKLGINNSIFADTCGISRATLSQLLTGRNKKVNDILIAQIHKAYPNVSILWLLFNEGDMWVKSQESSDNVSEDTQSGDENGNQSDDISLDQESSVFSQYPNVSSQSPMKNLYENSEFSGETGAQNKYPEEKGLNALENQSKSSIDQEINQRIKTASLMNEIEILRSKIKKVVQITIYYDDSTFESFFPK